MASRKTAILASVLLAFSLMSLLVGASRDNTALARGGPATATVLLKVVDFYGKALQGAVVEAYNASSPGRQLLYRAVSNSTGWAELEVPNGTLCDIEVYWLDEEVLVGLIDNMTVVGNITLEEPLRCWVCDLVVRASFEDGRPLVKGAVKLEGSSVGRGGTKVSFSRELSLNQSGVCVAEEMPMNSSYVIEGFRPGLKEPFDRIRLARLNGTITVNLTCPYLTVLVSVVDEHMRPLEGVLVKAYDWGTGSLVDEGLTDEKGLVSLKVLFGVCQLKALKDGQLLAELEKPVAENGTWCYLMCIPQNYSLKITVLDALGRPVPGLKVILVKGGQVLASSTTGPDGTVLFRGLGKGDLKVLVVLKGQTLAFTTIELVRDTDIEVRLADRIYIAGSLVGLPEFLTALLTGLTALAVLLTVFLWPKVKGKGELS